MPTAEVSRYNAAWGICGFTSALTHLYDSDERLKAKIDAGDEDKIKLGLLTEVVTFLKYVTAAREDLIEDLEKLNQALDSKAFNGGVAGFIKLAEKAVRLEVPIKDGIKNLFQCALTPEALTLYLQEMCVYKNATLTMGADPGGCGILGLYLGKELKHWVYRDAKGNVYNWGSIIKPGEWKTHAAGLGNKQFDHVGCHISFG